MEGPAMQTEDDDLDPEFVKRAGEKAIRLMNLHFGRVPITEYTQWDFDQMFRGAMQRAEPQDDDWNPEDWRDDV
jgi:hypothetical protein